jgi:prepilin-type N-terminal cleavage/methylation domain-containing protein
MKKLRRAFTLIELLAVIAIIGLLSAILAGLSPTSPTGISGATAQAQSVFSLARAQAMLANNPDPDQPDWKLYTPRARVIILNNPEDDQNHLRRMGVILGGQLVDPAGTARIKSEKELQEGDLNWYAVGEGVLLPDGVFYVDNANNSVTKQILRSSVDNKTFPSTPKMRVEFPRRKAQQSGSGPEWFYYEFLASGAANMTEADGTRTGARFIITEGTLNPGSRKLEPLAGKENNVGGFIILRPGNTVPIKNYEAK